MHHPSPCSLCDLRLTYGIYIGNLPYLGHPTWCRYYKLDFHCACFLMVLLFPFRKRNSIRQSYVFLQLYIKHSRTHNNFHPAPAVTVKHHTLVLLTDMRLLTYVPVDRGSSYFLFSSSSSTVFAASRRRPG